MWVRTHEELSLVRCPQIQQQLRLGCQFCRSDNKHHTGNKPILWDTDTCDVPSVISWLQERNHSRFRQISGRSFGKIIYAHAKIINVQLQLAMSVDQQKHVQKWKQFGWRTIFKLWCRVQLTQDSHADLLHQSTLDLNEKERDFKLNYSKIKSRGFLKFIGCAKHIRTRKLHRLNSKWQFQNDIFDLKSHYEILFWVQFGNGPSTNVFFNFRRWLCRSSGTFWTLRSRCLQTRKKRAR